MLAAILLCLAPTPKPVERLTPELLPGRWECRWGGTAAWFLFDAEGGYLYGTGEQPSYVGRWEIRGRDLWLTERSLHGCYWTEYTVRQIDMTRYPFVAGVVSGNNPFPIVLSNPKRFTE